MIQTASETVLTVFVKRFGKCVAPIAFPNSIALLIEAFSGGEACLKAEMAKTW